MHICKDAYKELLNISEDELGENSVEVKKSTTQAVLAVLKECDYITLEALSKVTNRQYHTVRACVEKLIKDGVVYKIKAVSPMHYCLTNKTLTSNGSGLSFQILKYLETHPRVTTEELSECFPEESSAMINYTMNTFLKYGVVDRVSRGVFLFNGLKYLKNTTIIKPKKVYKKALKNSTCPLESVPVKQEKTSLLDRFNRAVKILFG